MIYTDVFDDPSGVILSNDEVMKTINRVQLDGKYYFIIVVSSMQHFSIELREVIGIPNFEDRFALYINITQMQMLPRLFHTLMWNAIFEEKITGTRDAGSMLVEFPSALQEGTFSVRLPLTQAKCKK